MSRDDCYLPNDLAFESRVVVDIHDTKRPSCKTTPDQLIILAHIHLVQLSGRGGQRSRRDVCDRSSIQVVTVDQELPRNG